MLGLCISMWVIDACHSSYSHPGAPAHPFYPSKVLRARECTSTPHSSIIFYLNSHLSPLKNLGARQIPSLWYYVIKHHGSTLLEVTHSQLLEGFKCESQIENNGKMRSRGTLLGLQHFGGVEGHAGALGWDWEELTSFTYSHGPV